MSDPEPITPCAACEVGTATFVLPSGAPVCSDCYMALGRPSTETAGTIPITKQGLRR